MEAPRGRQGEADSAAAGDPARVLLPSLFPSFALNVTAAGPALEQMSDDDFLDEAAPEIAFTGDPACGSGLEVEDADLRDDQAGVEIDDLGGEATQADEVNAGLAAAGAPAPGDCESAARSWLAARVRLKARRIAGLPDDAALQADECAAFDRLREAIALEATLRDATGCSR